MEDYFLLCFGSSILFSHSIHTVIIFFILNHHYRIGSVVFLYHLAVRCAFWSPIALSLSLCVRLLVTGVFKNDTDYTVESGAIFSLTSGERENVRPLVTGWLLMVLLHLAMLRIRCDAGHHSWSANVCMCFVTNTGSMPNASAAASAAVVAAATVIIVLVCLCFVFIGIEKKYGFILKCVYLNSYNREKKYDKVCIRTYGKY